MSIIMRHSHLTPETPEKLRKTKCMLSPPLYCHIGLPKHLNNSEMKWWKGHSWKGLNNGIEIVLTIVLLCISPRPFPAAPQNKIQIQISSTAAVLAIFFRRKVQKYSIFEAKWHSFYRGEANFPNPHKIGEFLQKGAFCVSFRLRLWGRFAKLSSLRCILLHNGPKWSTIFLRYMRHYILGRAFYINFEKVKITANFY